MANIYEAMAEIMVDVDAIGKNQKNQQQGFKFRGIDDVYNAVHPILAKHGVFTLPTVLNERTEERQTNRGGNLIYRILTIKYTFYTSDGSSVDAVVIGEGMDSGDKAANKAMAVGHKYALLQALCIPTEDMIDPDSETPEQSSRKQGGNANFNKPSSTSPDHIDSPKSNAEKGSEKIIVTPIPQKMFTVKTAWSNILRLCDGDKAFAMGMFEQFGAESSERITYDIYKKVFDSISGGNVEGGPESFIDDDIPFEPSGVVA